jgi:hypothetical protein
MISEGQIEQKLEDMSAKGYKVKPQVRVKKAGGAINPMLRAAQKIYSGNSKRTF